MTRDAEAIAAVAAELSCSMDWQAFERLEWCKAGCRNGYRFHPFGGSPGWWQFCALAGEHLAYAEYGDGEWPDMVGRYVGEIQAALMAEHIPSEHELIAFAASAAAGAKDVAFDEASDDALDAAQDAEA